MNDTTLASIAIEDHADRYVQSIRGFGLGDSYRDASVRLATNRVTGMACLFG